MKIILFTACCLLQLGVSGQRVDLIADEGDLVIELLRLDVSGAVRGTIAFMVFDKESRLKHINSMLLHNTKEASEADLKFSSDYYYDSLGRVIRENVFQMDGDSTSLLRYGLYTYVPDGHDFRAYDGEDKKLLTEVVTRTEGRICTKSRLLDKALLSSASIKKGHRLEWRKYTWEIDSLGRAISLIEKSEFKSELEPEECEMRFGYGPQYITVSCVENILYTLHYDKNGRLSSCEYAGEQRTSTDYKYHRKTKLLSSITYHAVVHDTGQRVNIQRKFRVHKEFSPDFSDFSIDAINRELLQIFTKVPGHRYDDSRYYMFLN